jgi:uncharacterized SAM-binding protein YcdF (DUF218 family)
VEPGYDFVVVGAGAAGCVIALRLGALPGARVLIIEAGERGVPAAAVIQDSAGMTTMATARNSAALMKAHGLKTATVVTQYFHVPRTQLALRKAGVTADHTAHARFFEMRDLYSIPRELVGYAAYLIR